MCLLLLPTREPGKWWFIRAFRDRNFAAFSLALRVFSGKPSASSSADEIYYDGHTFSSSTEAPSFLQPWGWKGPLSIDKHFFLLLLWRHQNPLHPWPSIFHSFSFLLLLLLPLATSCFVCLDHPFLFLRGANRVIARCLPPPLHPRQKRRRHFPTVFYASLRCTHELQKNLWFNYRDNLWIFYSRPDLILFFAF